MREILFRGKTIKQNKGVTTEKTIKENMWVYGNLTIGEIEGYKADMISNKKEIYYINPETIGQYTGLTDKNGTEIFEGDIMPVWENGEKYLYKVVYCGDCFMLAMLDSEQGSYPLSIKHDISEVIGNIYDNPELLEVEE